MNDRTKPTKIDPDDIGHNESANPSFDGILAARLSRRNFMLGSVGTGAMAVFGGVSLGALAGCNSDSTAAVPAGIASNETLLAFSAVDKSLADVVVVPDGYSYSVLCALGDPLRAATGAYGNLGNDTDYENRFGDHHDGMDYFGLSAAGTPDPAGSERALIAMNHEATTDETQTSFFLHADGGTPSTSTQGRPAAEVDKEMAIHGISVFEIRKNAGSFAYVQDSDFNFRIHQNTPVEIHGPAAGKPLLVTQYSPTGTATRGTLNNCGAGKTPWGTLVSGEENWAGYFTRAVGDDLARTNAGDAKSVTSLKRYGRAEGKASRDGWETAGADDKYRRWDISLTGAAATADYRNELNTFGYIVEIDPYDRTLAARKRTALGRFAHESASFSVPVEGKPLAVYQGDDSKGEYIYKFVSTKTWVATDATRSDRLVVGGEYLDDGRLYVAKFNADGSGEWIELSMANVGGYAAYSFADQADVLVNARIAADAVGATRMDRPEWSAVNPANGEVYFTLTNNDKRGADFVADAANPRVYSDVKGTSKINSGNVNGHIIRLRENAGEAAATTFTWDVYLFGAESGAGSAINLSGLTTDQDFSSPDGLAFSKSTGICWIQTDDGAYTDVTNCMMLAALPGQVGDGEAVTVSGTGVTTYRGKQATADTLKRFLVGPKACEITGICESPDGRALFVNIQHPGESTLMADVAAGNAGAYTSHWPGNTGYGGGGAAARPRSATIVITKNDGGRIGS
jgi:secreted PhoX family phosphatase